MTIPILFHDAAVAAFLGVTALAGVSDLRSHRIPNSLSAALIALYPMYVLAAPAAVPWLHAVAVSIAVLAAGFALFALKLLGGGDGKLLAAAALWAGPVYIFDFLVITALAGGALALVFLSPLRMALASALPEGGLRERMLADVLPYGVAIAAGSWVFGLTLLQGAGQ